MERNTELLMGIRRIVKLYENMLREVCGKYGLTSIEVNIISFLYNNPGKDTAGDIVELRMLSKGNVSQAVEGLIQKKMIRRRQDTDDRRRIHLSLRPEAQPVIHDIEAIRDKFHERVFRGFSDDERLQYARFNDRIIANTQFDNEQE